MLKKWGTGGRGGRYINEKKVHGRQTRWFRGKWDIIYWMSIFMSLALCWELSILMRILCGGYYPCFFPDEESEAQDHRAHMERSKYKYMYDFSKAVPDYVTFTKVW